jgi:hypothetical protein
VHCSIFCPIRPHFGCLSARCFTLAQHGGQPVLSLFFSLFLFCLLMIPSNTPRLGRLICPVLHACREGVNCFHYFFSLFLLPSIRAFPACLPLPGAPVSSQSDRSKPAASIPLADCSALFYLGRQPPVQPTALSASKTQATSSRSGKCGLEKCCLSPPESPRRAPTWPALQGLPAGLRLSFVFAGFIRASKERR